MSRSDLFRPVSPPKAKAATSGSQILLAPSPSSPNLFKSESSAFRSLDSIGIGGSRDDPHTPVNGKNTDHDGGGLDDVLLMESSKYIHPTIRKPDAQSPRNRYGDSPLTLNMNINGHDLGGGIHAPRESPTSRVRAAVAASPDIMRIVSDVVHQQQRDRDQGSPASPIPSLSDSHSHSHSHDPPHPMSVASGEAGMRYVQTAQLPLSYHHSNALNNMNVNVPTTNIGSDSGSGLGSGPGSGSGAGAGPGSVSNIHSRSRPDPFSSASRSRELDSLPGGYGPDLMSANFVQQSQPVHNHNHNHNHNRNNLSLNANLNHNDNINQANHVNYGCQIRVGGGGRSSFGHSGIISINGTAPGLGSVHARTFAPAALRASNDSFYDESEYECDDNVSMSSTGSGVLFGDMDGLSPSASYEFDRQDGSQSLSQSAVSRSQDLRHSHGPLSFLRTSQESNHSSVNSSIDNSSGSRYWNTADDHMNIGSVVDRDGLGTERNAFHTGPSSRGRKGGKGPTTEKQAQGQGHPSVGRDRAREYREHANAKPLPRYTSNYSRTPYDPRMQQQQQSPRTHNQEMRVRTSRDGPVSQSHTQASVVESNSMGNGSSSRSLWVSDVSIPSSGAKPLIQEQALVSVLEPVSVTVPVPVPAHVPASAPAPAPVSVPVSVPVPVRVVATASQVKKLSVETKKDVVETAEEKSAYKAFHRNLKLKERISLADAEKFAEEALNTVIESIRWRVYLDLADLSKRTNDFHKARMRFRRACEMQPLASQVWLEWSKMEEECGRLRKSLRILCRGLDQCSFSEALLTRAIRQQEKLHKLQDARGMLSALKYESIEKTWRAVLEGALLEARAGRIVVARTLFQFLIQNVPWYGPIYHEAYKLEEKNGYPEAATEVVRCGLAELPRYGPLWFGLFRVMENADLLAERSSFFYGRVPQMRRLHSEVDTSVRLISRELVWKVYFEQAQALERATEISALGLLTMSNRHASAAKARDMLFGEARKALVRSVLACPTNLRWKVWLAGARLELGAGRVDRARRLLCQALLEAPNKSRSWIYLECSRVEEYSGNVSAARRILQRAASEAPQEWKLSFEAILLEARAGSVRRAWDVAHRSLDMHPGTGRLWALYVHLCHRLECTSQVCDDEEDRGGPPSMHEALLRALRDVPKSGEVWTEGARCRLNPMHAISFDVGGAQKFLGFAIQFTAQYGDTFVEMMRVELLGQVLLPRILSLLGLPVRSFLFQFLSYDGSTDTAGIVADSTALQSLTLKAMTKDMTHQQRLTVLTDMLSLRADISLRASDFEKVSIDRLLRRCINAEPNYGSAWAHSRSQTTKSPAEVLRSVLHSEMIPEMMTALPLYVRACCHYLHQCYESLLSEPPVTVTVAGAKNRTRIIAGKARPLDVSSSIYGSGSPEQEDIRAREFLQDFQTSCHSLNSQWDSSSGKCLDCGVGIVKEINVPSLPIVDLGEGRVFISTDFVTALVGLNRLVCNCTLKAEQRRKILYESDQVVA